MSTTELIRWSGGALLAGGVALALFVLSHPPGEFGPEASSSGHWVISHSLHFVGAVLVLFGLIGLHVRQMRRAGRLGNVGFVLAFVGTTMLAGTGMISAYIVPRFTGLLEAPKDGGLTLDAVPFVLAALFMIAGYTLLGIAIARAGLLPRLTALPLIVGAVLFDLPPFAVPRAVLVVGGILFGSALAWLGYSLWSATPARAGAAEATARA